MCSMYSLVVPCFILFFFNATATTAIYTLSLHDALPICPMLHPEYIDYVIIRDNLEGMYPPREGDVSELGALTDRKSTRLNSSHEWISYAVFCLKKKTQNSNCLFHTSEIVQYLVCASGQA